jgi:hypothetical protein
VLGHVQDYQEARSIVRRLLDGLPSGSYFVQCDGVDSDPAYLEASEHYAATGAIPYIVRSYAEIAGFYEGLEPVDPGVVPIHLWGAQPNPFGEPPDVAEVGGVGRKT